MKKSIYLAKNSEVQWQRHLYRNLWQHPLWAQFQETVGRKTFLLTTKKTYALVLRHALPMNLCYLEIPRGPLFEAEADLPELMEKINTLAKAEKAIFVRMSPYCALSEAKDSPLFKAWKLLPSKKDAHPEASLIIDLHLPKEEILAQMKPKGRYSIKFAEKHGVTVEPSDDVDAFYAILVKTGHRDGFGIHPKSYYKAMLQALGKQSQLLMAYREGQAIAGGIFVYLEKWSFYYYGASDHNHRKYLASYLVQWTAIQEAKKRGCALYDFLGIAPSEAKNHAWAGVTAFKKKFGGQGVDYPPAKDLVVHGFWYFLYRLRQKLR